VRVLHVISSAGMYGAESVILTLMRQMQRNGTPHVLGVFDNLASPNHALHEIALKNGIESHLLPCSGQIDRTTLRSIRNLAAQTSAEVIHAHGYKADVYSYFAMRSSKTPLVSTCHNWLDLDFATKLYGALDRYCLKRFAAIAAVSRDVQNRLLSSHIEANKISIIPNGIEWNTFADKANASIKSSGNADEPLVVGFAGRLSREKGIDLFITAAHEIARVLPNVQFVIAGDGAEREASIEAIEENNLSGKVKLLGRVDDMPSFYASIDVLLSPSRTEGSPMGLMEAMASGIPVVATNVGDVSTLVEDGVTGMLVRSTDAAAMQQAVIKLLSDAELRDAISKAAQQRIIEQFSAERMARDYDRMYERVVA
jgi:glycosyltransferase involved in cell wall biosynthesis